MKTNPNLPGLYVHVPFCRSKCHYCDFYSITAPNRIPQYLKALGYEIDLISNEWSDFETVYIGGGTPGYLQLNALQLLFDKLSRLIIGDITEYTVELNPENVTHEMLDLLSVNGVNRISLGIQTFDDSILTFLGRSHTSKTTQIALEIIGKHTDLQVSTDMIFGYPNHTSKKMETDLKRLIEYQPDHISCYQLTIEPGTRFAKEVRLGQIRLPSNDDQYDLFMAYSEFLTKNGYTHYEISNYASDTTAICRHNMKYWRREPYLGLGPSAHSFLQNRRWWNPKSIQRYSEKLMAGKSPSQAEETITTEMEMIERIYLGARTNDGIPKELLESCPIARDNILKFKEDGFLTEENTHWKLTPRGFAVADGMIEMVLRSCFYQVKVNYD